MKTYEYTAYDRKKGFSRLGNQGVAIDTFHTNDSRFGVILFTCEEAFYKIYDSKELLEYDVNQFLKEALKKASNKSKISFHSIGELQVIKDAMEFYCDVLYDYHYRSKSRIITLIEPIISKLIKTL